MPLPLPAIPSRSEILTLTKGLQKQAQFTFIGAPEQFGRKHRNSFRSASLIGS